MSWPSSNRAKANPTNPAPYPPHAVSQGPNHVRRESPEPTEYAGIDHATLPLNRPMTLPPAGSTDERTTWRTLWRTVLTGLPGIVGRWPVWASCELHQSANCWQPRTVCRCRTLNRRTPCATGTYAQANLWIAARRQQRVAVRLLGGEGSGEVDTQPITVPVIQQPAAVHLVDGHTRRDADPPRRFCNLAISRQAIERLDAGLTE